MRRGALQAAAWWLAALAILAAAAVWIGADGAGLPPLDRRGLELADAWRGPVLDAAFLGLTWLGSLSVLLPLVSAAAILLWRRGSPAEAGFLALALGGAAALAHPAKELFARPRPEAVPGLSPAISSLSFPSAHAMQITAVALAVFIPADVPVTVRPAPAVPALGGDVAAAEGHGAAQGDDAGEKAHHGDDDEKADHVRGLQA